MMRAVIYLLLGVFFLLPGIAEAYLDPSGASIFWQLLIPVFLFIVGLPILFFRFILRKIDATRHFFLKAILRRSKIK